MISVEGDFVRTWMYGLRRIRHKAWKYRRFGGVRIILGRHTFFGRKTASLFVLFFDNKNPENKLKVNYLTFILSVGEKIVPQG